MTSEGETAKNIWDRAPHQKCTKCRAIPDLCHWSPENWADEIIPTKAQNLIKVKCPLCVTKKAGTFFICLCCEKITSQQACRLRCKCGVKRSGGNNSDEEGAQLVSAKTDRMDLDDIGKGNSSIDHNSSGQLKPYSSTEDLMDLNDTGGRKPSIDRNSSGQLGTY